VLLLSVEGGSRQLCERIKKVCSWAGVDPDSDIVKENLIISQSLTRLDLLEKNPASGSPSSNHELELALDEYRPNLLILDPLYKLHRGLEDSASEMAPMLSNLHQVTSERDIACLLVHHQGKHVEGRSFGAVHSGRGSSAMSDVPDVLLCLKRSNRQIIMSSEFRNRENLGILRFEFDSEHGYTVVESLDASLSNPRLTSSEVVEKIPPQGICKRDLLKSLKDRAGESTILNRLNEAIENGAVKRETKGKEAYFYPNRKSVDGHH
jgi:hypothetical protein